MSLRPNSRVEGRRNRYKVAVDAEEGRRRREDNMVEIRKNRREESLQKKRREGVPLFSVPVESTTGTDKKVQLENLPSMVASIWTDDASRQLEATTQFRKLLSIERSPPLQEVIQAGVVPRFVEFLMREDFPQLLGGLIQYPSQPFLDASHRLWRASPILYDFCTPFTDFEENIMAKKN
ncbi:hypothetical protein RD792_002097 [Penstemon davidsonii]|uniref:IBB domain-containing protein n=1 Tax=Penstemon davidsonii TaxID=160366 RepID=A0ABR0DQ54_9LAMI|nr:hypothetical protein RD792_002097 [Penstemon davidsonii]